MVQAVRIQTVQGAYYRDMADSLTTAYRNIEAVRGNIYAADGSLLATSVPIYDVRLKQQVLDTLDIQWRDNVKARIIDAKQSNAYVKRGNKRSIRSQQQIYEYLARQQGQLINTETE